MYPFGIAFPLSIISCRFIQVFACINGMLIPIAEQYFII